MVIEYKKGYKYQLHKYTKINTNIHPAEMITGDFYALNPNGELVIYKGYAWDGASGVPDFPSVLRASLYHDCLYQMMREDGLDHKWRKEADELLEEVAIEDGANRFVVALIYWAVVYFGEPFTEGKHAKKVMKAGK